MIESAILGETERTVALSVLMPCYEDGAYLAENIKATLADLDALLQITYEIVVIDDGSTDATYQEACRVARADPRVNVVQIPQNSGKGVALQAGFDASRGRLICFLDSDLQISARHIPRFIECLEREKTDMVIASKRHPLSSVDYPRTRRILSRFFQLLTSVLFRLPLKDTQAGLKLFRREVLQQIFPKALVKRYAFDVELLANAHRVGYKIVEAPVEIHLADTSNSHVDLSAILRMLRDTLGIFYRMYVTAYYDRVFPEISEAPRVAVLEAPPPGT